MSAKVFRKADGFYFKSKDGSEIRCKPNPWKWSKEDHDRLREYAKLCFLGDDKESIDDAFAHLADIVLAKGIKDLLEEIMHTYEKID